MDSSMTYWQMLLNQLRKNIDNLQFADPQLEQSFRDDYQQKSVGRFRIGILLGTGLYSFFGLLDEQLIPEIMSIAWFIRFGIMLPLMLLCLVVSFSEQMKKYFLGLVVFISYVAAIGIIAMVALADSPGNYLYYAGLLLCVTFCFAFLQLPFRHASILCWVIFGLYEITAIWISHSSVPIIVNNTFFFLGFNITGIFASYSIEKYKRADFLQQRTIREQTERLREALLEIERKRLEAEETSRRDPLTNLFNRRYFFSIVEYERNKYKRYGRGLAVMLLDVDHFKKVNDSYGHVIGDTVLQNISRLIQNNIRQADVACRYGGDEFICLFPETSLKEAYDVARRICDGCQHLSIPTDQGVITLTISAGVAALDGQTDTNQLMEKADKALYSAKQSGRNQVKVWEHLEPRVNPVDLS